MSSTPSRRSRTRAYHHIWTPFEQHTLLCLLCRQIQLTGSISSTSASTSTSTSTSASPRRRRRRRVSPLTDQQHTYTDVADLLNRSLNHSDHTKDIPAEEVSAMVDRLMQERKGAVRFLERQGVARITRGVRRVWERAGLEWRDGSEADENAGRKGRWNDGNVVGGADGVEHRALRSVDDAHGKDDDDDLWGDKVVARPALNEDDGWGDDVMTSSTNVEVVNGAKNRDDVDTLMTDAEDTTDPWASNKSTFVDGTDTDDPRDLSIPTNVAETNSSAGPWASSQPTATINTINSGDDWPSSASTSVVNAANLVDEWAPSALTVPVNTSNLDDEWASWNTTDAIHTQTTNLNNSPGVDHTSATFVSTANPDPVSSEAEATISTQHEEVATTITASSSPPQHQRAFTGLNSERLAMLNAQDDANEDIEEEEYISKRPAYAPCLGNGRGENAVELPFNRLATLNSKKNAD